MAYIISKETNQIKSLFGEWFWSTMPGDKWQSFMKKVTVNYYRVSHERGYNDENFSEADEILWRLDQ